MFQGQKAVCVIIVNSQQLNLDAGPSLSLHVSQSILPGDAQWGTWEEALNSKWRDLLEKTTFYKIGHHASHNATPISFVEDVLGEKFWAMACTGPTQKWTKIIPRTKLMEKLREKSNHVIRSDKQDVVDPSTSNFKREAGNAYTQVEIDI